MKSFIRIICLTLCIYASDISLSSAHDIDVKGEGNNKDYEKETFLGDWGTIRSKLREQGIQFEIEYYGDVFSQVRGGVKRATGYAGLIDLEMYLDGERLFGWQGAKFSVYAIDTHGVSFQKNVGSVHDVSSLVAPDGFKMFEMWYEQSFLEEEVSLLLGLYDVDREFDYRPTAQLFLSGAFGTGIDLSGSGKNGPSIFPVTSLGGRLKILPKPDLYYQLAVVDGVPGDPAKSNGTHIKFKKDDGILAIQEVGYESVSAGDSINKAAVGGWLYTTPLEDLVRVDAKGELIKHAGTYGIYLFVDGTFYPENLKPVNAFFRIGIADSKVSEVNFYMDGGVVYEGIFDKRPNDLLGVGLSLAHLSGGFKEKQQQNQINVADSEIQLEVTYKYEVGPGVSLQSGVQYLFNPALVKDAEDALSVGLRLAIEM
jgi:porin